MSLENELREAASDVEQTKALLKKNEKLIYVALGVGFLLGLFTGLLF